MKNVTMLLRTVLFTALFLAISATDVFAITDLGSGFKCDGTTIIKGTKTVTFTKAKSNLITTIQKLKDAKAAASSQGQKAKIQAKLNAAKSAKTLVTACSKGQLSSNQVDPVFSNLASGSGHFVGNYSGTVTYYGIPIALEGTVDVQFTLQGTLFTGTLGLGGGLGNALNFQPLSFSNDVGGIGFPAQFFLANTFLGNVTLSVTQGGLLTITNDVQSKSVNFSGQFSTNTIAGSISGVYSGASYTGTFSLNRQ